MKKIFNIILAFTLVLGLSLSAQAEGDANAPGDGKFFFEDGAAMGGPSAADMKAAIEGYVNSNLRYGTYRLKDPETGKIRRLKLTRVHSLVRKTGNYYFSCADFTDTSSGEMLDLDFDVVERGENLRVAAVKIHKVNGVERYTYDRAGNRVKSQETEPLIKEDHGSHSHGSHSHGSRKGS